MGYTNYFTQTVTSDRDSEMYRKFAVDAKAILETAEQRGIELANGMGEIQGQWEVSDTRVIFNGLGDDSHETFLFTREDNLGFNFCKTAHKPYDAVVTACLIALGRAYGESVSIDSDGAWDDNDWTAGRALYQMAVMQTAISPIKS
jgi:hypothetical protein